MVTRRDLLRISKSWFRLYRLTTKFFGTYKNTDTPILMRHSVCLKEFEMRPACFIKGQRCPHCARSIGAELVGAYLKTNNVEYQIEKVYEDLFDINELKFDFYLPAYDVLIEYDGEQHFRLKTFGAKYEKALKEFETLQKHDLMKNQYCKSNGITLLRIPYWRKGEINSILETFLELLKDTENNTLVLENFICSIFSKNGCK